MQAHPPAGASVLDKFGNFRRIEADMADKPPEPPSFRSRSQSRTRSSRSCKWIQDCNSVQKMCCFNQINYNLPFISKQILVREAVHAVTAVDIDREVIHLVVAVIRVREAVQAAAIVVVLALTNITDHDSSTAIEVVSRMKPKLCQIREIIRIFFVVGNRFNRGFQNRDFRNNRNRWNNNRNNGWNNRGRNRNWRSRSRSFSRSRSPYDRRNDSNPPPKPPSPPPQETANTDAAPA